MADRGSLAFTDWYCSRSKHGCYQTLPTALLGLLDGTDIVVKSRHDLARLSFISRKFDIKGLRVADIGGNVGYFSFEMLGLGAESVLYFEGNKPHFDFVSAAAFNLGLRGRVQTFNRYVGFQLGELPKVDLTLLLNVLHHVGDDFGDPGLSAWNAKLEILRCLEVLSYSSKWLVLQLGFNWKGDCSQPLFESGTKAEMIQFVSEGTKGYWAIQGIGCAEVTAGGVEFRDLDEGNVGRDDGLGEFLNRPMFVMHSKSIA